MNARTDKKVLVLLFNKFTNDSRVLKECTSLVAAGYGVELWANYAEDLPEHEVIQGCVVRRKFGKPAGKASGRWHPVRALRDLLRSGLQAVRRLSPALHDAAKGAYIRVEQQVVDIARGKSPLVRKLKRPFRQRALRQAQRQAPAARALPPTPAFDFIHCNDLLPLPLAVDMKNRDPRTKLIYDSHEYQTESASVVNNPSRKRQYEELERDHIGHVDAVITVSASIAREYERLYGLTHVHVVHNFPSLTAQAPRNEYFREKFGLRDDDLIFLYQGGLVKKVRGIEQTLECFIRLRREGHDRHHVVFMGYGNMEQGIAEIAARHDNIHFHPAIAPERIPEVSCSADYGTIFAPNICASYDFSLPNKLFEYIVCGLPIVTTPLQDMARLVREEDIGFITDDFSSESIYQTLRAIAARPDAALRDRIQALHREKYNWDIEERSLLDIYRNA